MSAVRGMRRYQAAILVALTLGLPSAALAKSKTAGERAEALSRITIDNFGQVNDSYYGVRSRRHDFASLARLGVKTVIDLAREGDRAEVESRCRYAIPPDPNDDADRPDATPSLSS